MCRYQLEKKADKIVYRGTFEGCRVACTLKKAG
jgi:hypothetical protein